MGFFLHLRMPHAPFMRCAVVRRPSGRAAKCLRLGADRSVPIPAASTFVKQVTAAGFQLKGLPLIYVTDFRGGGAPAGDKAEREDRQTEDRPTGGRPQTAGGSAAARGRRRFRHRPKPGRRHRKRREIPAHRPAGLVPLGITVWVLTWAGRWTACSTGCCRRRRLAAAESRRTPASSCAACRAGVLAMGLLLTGVFATNIFGQWWLRQWNRLLAPHPHRALGYSSRSRCPDTLFSSNGNAFREAVLVQTRAGSWTIAFVTGKPGRRGGCAITCPAGVSACTCRRRPTRPRASS